MAAQSVLTRSPEAAPLPDDDEEDDDFVLDLDEMLAAAAEEEAVAAAAQQQASCGSWASTQRSYTCLVLRPHEPSTGPYKDAVHHVAIPAQALSRDSSCKERSRLAVVAGGAGTADAAAQPAGRARHRAAAAAAGFGDAGPARGAAPAAEPAPAAPHAGGPLLWAR